MSRRSDKILFYIVNTFFISIVISIIIGSFFYGDGFKKRALLTTGYISSMGSSGDYKTGGYFYSFTYKVKEKEYSGTNHVRRLNFIKRIKQKQKKLHVLYDSLDPSDSRILIYEADYVEYGLVMPDSMKWLNDLLY